MIAIAGMELPIFFSVFLEQLFVTIRQIAVLFIKYSLCMVEVIFCQSNKKAIIFAREGRIIMASSFNFFK